MAGPEHSNFVRISFHWVFVAVFQANCGGFGAVEGMVHKIGKCHNQVGNV